MSNPFRRESRSAPTTNTAVPTIFPEADQYGYRASDLSINTKVPAGSLERHVSFASPPVDSTIPAADYPSSPESTRFSPPSQVVKPVLPAPTDYSAAIQSDPFRLEDLKDERDGAIKEALQNAQHNTVIVDARQPISREDAVRDTLSRFASVPRETSGNVNRDNSGKDNNTTFGRQTMDVEAFKRLLLTGDSGQSTPKVIDATSTNAQPISANDSSSSADTASLSQRSVFENLIPASENTPRSSQELDPIDVRAIRDDNGMKQKAQPPPAPNPRRAKSVKRDENEIKPESSSLRERTSADPSANRSLSVSGPGDNSKRPPTPPLARRQSAKGGIINNDRRRSSDGDPETMSISSVTSSRAPPPPPSRRRDSATRRSSSIDLEPTAEEPDQSNASTLVGRNPPGARPPPPPTRNSSSAKRASLGMMNPPPIPPPRRNRGSSRSSIDSHRPSMSAIMGGGEGDSARSSGEYMRSGVDSRRVSTASNANSILADLASLQRELEEARQRSK